MVALGVRHNAPKVFRGFWCHVGKQLKHDSPCIVASDANVWAGGRGEWGARSCSCERKAGTRTEGESRDEHGAEYGLRGVPKNTTGLLGLLALLRGLFCASAAAAMSALRSEGFGGGLIAVTVSGGVGLRPEFFQRLCRCASAELHISIKR